MNISFWIKYYFKCGFNLVFSKWLYLQRNIQNKFNYDNHKKKEKLGENCYIVTLDGDYYQMGKQYGEIMKDILLIDVDKALIFIKNNEYFFLKKIKPIIKNNTDNILEATLLLFERINNLLSNDIIDYFKGVAFGSNIDFNKLIIVNLFCELMDNHCIIYNKKTNNGLLNLRTLDYGIEIFTQTLVIFNPTNKNKYLSLNLSFMFGIVTGLNEKGIIIGERYCDYFLGWSDDMGIPFQFLFHNLLANANNFDDGESILKKSKRMGNLHIGVSDIKNKKACIYNYSQSKIEKNMEINENNSLAYSVSPKEKRLFEKYKDDFNNAEELINNILPIIKSGELHVFIYDNDYIYISVTTDYLQSYNNKFYKLSLNQLFRN